MVLVGLILSIIMMIVFGILGCADYKHEEIWFGVAVSFIIIATFLLFFGIFYGFINHPATEGTHIGVITAVDLEGIYFRRYEVYLKSSGYTNQSDETKYLIYADEKELAEELQNLIGQKVKLHYGHDGGYISWNSCGTYHIKSVEKVEE